MGPRTGWRGFREFACQPMGLRVSKRFESLLDELNGHSEGLSEESKSFSVRVGIWVRYTAMKSSWRFLPIPRDSVPYQNHDPQNKQAKLLIILKKLPGVTLLRAAAKNHERVTVLTNPKDYDRVLREMEKNEGG